MKRPILAMLFVFFVSSLAIGDKPATPKRKARRAPSERKEDSAVDRRPPAKVPASRAARAEWQRRLEQRQQERQRQGAAGRGDGEERQRTSSNPPRRSEDSRDSRRNRRRPEKPDARQTRNDNSRKTNNDGSSGRRRRGRSDSDRDAGKFDESKDLPIIVPQAVRVPSYAAVRSTIPFSRSEWEADPSYRHNGTMELLLGQLRDMVVYRSPPVAGPAAGPGVTINNGGGRQFPGFFNGFGNPFGFNPGLNGAIQSRAIINALQTQGFIGRMPPTLP